MGNFWGTKGYFLVQHVITLFSPEVDPAFVDPGVLHFNVGDDELGRISRVAEVAPRAEVPIL